MNVLQYAVDYLEDRMQVLIQAEALYGIIKVCSNVQCQLLLVEGQELLLPCLIRHLVLFASIYAEGPLIILHCQAMVAQSMLAGSCSIC